MRPLESIEHKPHKPDCSGGQGQHLTDERGRTPNPRRHAPAITEPAESQHHAKVGYGDEGNGAAQLNILDEGSCERRGPWMVKAGLLRLLSLKLSTERTLLDNGRESSWAL